MPTDASTTESTAAEEKIRGVLDQWAAATRTGAQDRILANHDPDVVIYDVLPPMKYVGAAAYRESWDEWQPETEDEITFALHDLEISAGQDVAFAHGLLHCGGTTVDGTEFEDRVRATFCLRRHGERWLVAHQHISAPRS